MLKQKLITDYFYPLKYQIFGHNLKTDSWHCLKCGIDMGTMNPRQLCGKWMCDYNFE